jgi:hypothetical protein
MNQTIEEKNKALVLAAFDTLFNKRDYASAERYCFFTNNESLLVAKADGVDSRELARLPGPFSGVRAGVSRPHGRPTGRELR